MLCFFFVKRKTQQNLEIRNQSLYDLLMQDMGLAASNLLNPGVLHVNESAGFVIVPDMLLSCSWDVANWKSRRIMSLVGFSMYQTISWMEKKQLYLDLQFSQKTGSNKERVFRPGTAP